MFSPGKKNTLCNSAIHSTAYPFSKTQFRGAYVYPYFSIVYFRLNACFRVAMCTCITPP